MTLNSTKLLSLLLACTILVGTGTVQAQQLNDTILIDFGTELSPSPYNNATSGEATTVISLINKRELATSYTMAVTDPFNGVNVEGTQTPDASLGFPATATEDSFFGNTVEFSEATEPTGAITFYGLKPGTEYSFTITASRADVADIRSATYVAEGAEDDSASLDASNNTSESVTVSAQPKSDSTIVLRVSGGEDNDNGNGFYYLGAVSMSYPFEDVAPPPSGGEDLLDTVLVDFSQNNITPRPWNNVTNFIDGMVDNLINSGGFSTGYSIAITDRFHAVNTDGTANANVALGFPSTATGDSFFGNSSEWNGRTEPTGAVEILGLDPDVDYNLEIFASRMNVSDSRETQYVIQGATESMMTLEVANNTDEVAEMTVRPAIDGSITITASPGANNTSMEGFFYLGLIRLTYENMDPVGPASLLLVSPNDGEYWQVGDVREITWRAMNVGPLVLEYTTDDDGPWTIIDTVPGYAQAYSWTIPNAPTSEARVRLRADGISDMSDQTFIITEDSSECAIVVLGSSTAEGVGASTQDSAWVDRYRSSFTGDGRFDVINLGRGGFNSYNILPTGTLIADSISSGVDRNRNITKALALDPFAIIINLPSNDAASGFPVADQLRNLKTITDAADAAGVLVYVSTTQPRDFSDDARVAYQMEVRDSIYAIYGDNAIDFWSGFSDDTGRLVDSLDSGDGIHVNDAGHRILFERVAALQLDTLECNADTTGTSIRNLYTPLAGVSVYPNPSVDGVVYVEFDGQLSGDAEIRMVDLLGRERYRRSFNVQDVNRRLAVPTTNLSSSQSGEYLLCTVMLKEGNEWRRKTFGIMVR